VPYWLLHEARSDDENKQCGINFRGQVAYQLVGKPDNGQQIMGCTTTPPTWAAINTQALAIDNVKRQGD
jgi:hypothetical protein